MNFKIGDKVRVTGLAFGDEEMAKVEVGFTGTIFYIDHSSYIDYSKENFKWMKEKAAYVVFDQSINSYNLDNGRYLPIRNLELIQPEKKVKRGFQVGDRVVVVRDNRAPENILDDVYGRIGYISRNYRNPDLKDGGGYDVRFPDWENGWIDRDNEESKGCDSWSVNGYNLRRMVTK